MGRSGKLHGPSGACVTLTAWNVVVLVAWVLAPFVCARTMAWVVGWLYVGVVAAGALAEARHVARCNPALRARRRRIGPGTKAWDLAWNALFWPLMASIDVVARLVPGVW